MLKDNCPILQGTGRETNSHWSQVTYFPPGDPAFSVPITDVPGVSTSLYYSERL